jgi:hypothetical protein
MCATVCPSQALYYGRAEDIGRMRVETPVNEFQFGNQTVRTKVRLMSAPLTDHLEFDVMAFMPGAGDVKPDITELVVWED